MKTIWTVVISLAMGATLVVIGALGGWLIGSSQPTPAPLVLSELITVEVPKIIEKEVIRTVEVEKVVEVVVTPTPGSEATPVALPAPTDLPTPIPQPTPVPCTNAAWIDTQPKSDLQGDALKLGTINRLTFVLINTGTCPWDGNQLVSMEDPFPPVAVPYTAPGGTAVFTADDFIVRQPLELRLYMQTPNGELFGFENGNPVDGSIYYRMDTYTRISQAQSYTGSGLLFGRFTCGPSG